MFRIANILRRVELHHTPAYKEPQAQLLTESASACWPSTWNDRVLLKRIEKRLPEIEKRLPEVEKRLPEVEKRLPEVEKRLPEVEKRLPEVEKRLPEVEKRLPEVEKRLPEVEKRLPEVEKRLPEVEKRLLSPEVLKYLEIKAAEERRLQELVDKITWWRKAKRNS
ncbi:hypothetical protein B0T10DRAFT_567066 [Thelonectria olida]|uniref:Uncharacterized protein n=1 Tax=Thelonectria olida TaxID=1576542 RepID=A0A9P8VTA3_9HYPO|nr:hypothetical protein B0T10DRAFT_567066 [Thelonectria olida]